MSSLDYLFGLPQFEPSVLPAVILHVPLDIPEVFSVPTTVHANGHTTRRGVHVTNYGQVTNKHRDFPKFHKKSYIYPIGFTSTKSWLSSVDPTKKCEHTCEIIDDGDRPMFRVTASDRPLSPITKTTPGGAWNAIKKRVNGDCTNVQEQYPGLISGPEYFGLFCKTTISQCEKLDTDEVCREYWDAKAQGYSAVGSKARN
jgi:hypothetical protein